MNRFKNKKIIIIGFSLVILTILLVVSINCEKLINENNSGLIYINNVAINVKTVNTNQTMYQGLSGQRSLCDNCGMLFDYPNSAERNFVMRNMKFPLDIIFFNEGKITKIAANLSPEGKSPVNLYSSGGPANKVLEVNAGFAAEHGLLIGDQLMTVK